MTDPRGHEAIRLRGVRTNNLKNIDIDFPIGRITAVTGVSGSGKSSLVFATLYAEAYRRYVESLSSFARQYLQALPKPDLDSIDNLPPAIAVKQSRSGASNRSTVGTMTEIFDILRILFVHLSHPYCGACARPVCKATPEAIVETLLKNPLPSRLTIAAPLKTWDKLKVKDLREYLLAQGFTRVTYEGEVLRIADAKASPLRHGAVIIDRLKADPEQRSRLFEAVTTGLKLGRGHVVAQSDEEEIRFSDSLACEGCDRSFREPTLALFSFNHPLGACDRCQGFGYVAENDYDRCVPDKQKSLKDEGVAVFNFGERQLLYRAARASAKARGLAIDKPFAEYSKADWAWLCHGDKEGGGRFSGIDGFFRYLDRKKYRRHFRIHAARYRSYRLCQECEGIRLNSDARAYRIGNHSIGDLSLLPLSDLAIWFANLAPTNNGVGDLANDDSTVQETGMDINEAIAEGVARTRYLETVGLSYLNLLRSSRTLSGGETQRINMARSLGSAMTETLFCLDEPSSGLHARDSERLLSVIRELRDQGNSVVLVEHERTLLKGADHAIEIGPKAGHEGGFVVNGKQRSVKQSAKQETSLSPIRSSVKAAASPTPGEFFTLKGARTNNLQNVTVKIPVGALTVVCGVSGSGKTSLVQQTLYPLLAHAFGQTLSRNGGGDPDPVADGVGPPRALRRHSEVALMSQGALGRSSRSNIATYLGLMTEIRRLFAQEPLAHKLGLAAGSFSFNTPGGRCETCRGMGTILEDLSFLGEMEVVCPECEGRRFHDQVLSVMIRDHNLLDILAMTVSQAREFFFEHRKVVKACDAVDAMGMGYITLGQPTSSFSGGEAQRLKMVRILQGVELAHPSVLIFDEPTTGLADPDVARLLTQLHALTAQGHTIIVVEHHLDVIRGADWLIEIGPEAAAQGGSLVYEGRPEGLAAIKDSVTARFLSAAVETQEST